MYICVLNEAGEVLVHRNLPCDRERFLAAIAPYREDLVVAVECLFCWYWLADLCAEEGIAFVLGHALYMKAVHGGKPKNDRVDSYKIATLLRGGTLPQAYVYPRGMRATRDLLRRRLFFARKRGELLSHIQNTNTQYNLPALEKRIDRPANRGALIEHFDGDSVQMSVGTRSLVYGPAAPGLIGHPLSLRLQHQKLREGSGRSAPPPSPRSNWPGRGHPTPRSRPSSRTA